MNNEPEPLNPLSIPRRVADYKFETSSARCIGEVKPTHKFNNIERSIKINDQTITNKSIAASGTYPKAVGRS